MYPTEAIEPLQWKTIEPLFTALLKEDLTAQSIPSWLNRWSDLEKIIWEARAHLKRDRSYDENNSAAQHAFQRFVEEIFSPYQLMNQALKTKLLAVPNYVPAPEHLQMLRFLRVEASLFRQENIPLQAEVDVLSSEYGRKAWDMFVRIGSETIPLPQAEEHVAGQGRNRREQAWRLTWTRWHEERAIFDQLFLNLLHKRRQLAHNAGLPDYRTYRWREMGRLDYTPADCLSLHDAIEAEIMPLTAVLREQRRQSLGLTSMRPWDKELSAQFDTTARPFADTRDFEARLIQVYHKLDPELGALFERMRHGYLDLGARIGKPHGGEEWLFSATGLPCIRAYTVGSYEDVGLVLHESGHAFHDALSQARQGLFWNIGSPSEFSEFAAITMTYLATPYLEQKYGGFYTPEIASQVYRKALEDVIVKWLPSIIQVDAFQHWVYTSAPTNVTPADLDAQWLELSMKFEADIDWSGLEQERAMGWQRMSMIFSAPFYQIEYALAHLGALQLWQKAQDNFATTWNTYREALLTGNTRSVPELYQAAGVELPFAREVVKKVAEFLIAAFDA